MGEQPLQAGILTLQALEADGLGLGEAAVLLAPPIEGVAGNPITPDEARDRLPTQLLLAQMPNDVTTTRRLSDTTRISLKSSRRPLSALIRSSSSSRPSATSPVNREKQVGSKPRWPGSRRSSWRW